MKISKEKTKTILRRIVSVAMFIIGIEISAWRLKTNPQIDGYMFLTMILCGGAILLWFTPLSKLSDHLYQKIYIIKQILEEDDSEDDLDEYEFESDPDKVIKYPFPIEEDNDYYQDEDFN